VKTSGRGPTQPNIFFKVTIAGNKEEKMRGGMKSRNAFYLSVQNIVSSSLLFKNIKIKMHRTIIYPVVLYGCEIWSLTLREKRRLRAYENGVLRGLFRPKKDEVAGEWRKLHNEELSDLYCSPNIVRVIK
jgi:hypothetical protein